MAASPHCVAISVSCQGSAFKSWVGQGNRLLPSQEPFLVSEEGAVVHRTFERAPNQPLWFLGR